MKEILGVKIYTAEEASQLLGVSLVTLRQMIRDGRLPANKIRKAWAIPEESIKGWLLGRKPQNLAPQEGDRQGKEGETEQG